MRIVLAIVLTVFSANLSIKAEAAEIVLVSFTAEWCPNCKVLDPKVREALARVPVTQVRHLVLDMSDSQTKKAAFEMINGTVFADVYGDHLGVTGIGILTAPDSGEKIGCITRDHSVVEIIDLIIEAQNIVDSQPALQRQVGRGACPVANDKLSF